MIVTVSSKGQIVIPVPFRKRMGIKAGTQVTFREKDGSLVIEPVGNVVRRLRGSMRGSKALEYLLAERRKELVP